MNTRAGIPQWALRAGLALIAAQLVLSLLFIASLTLVDDDSTVVTRFSLYGEASLPSWWSTLIIFSAGVTSLVIWATTRQLGAPGMHWAILGFGFVALSADEAAAIHELVGGTLGTKLGFSEEIWPLIYLPAFAIALWALWTVAREVTKPASVLLFAGMGVLVASVLTDTVRASVNAKSLVEENLEMGGIGLALIALLLVAVERVRGWMDLARRDSPRSVSPSIAEVQFQTAATQRKPS